MTISWPFFTIAVGAFADIICFGALVIVDDADADADAEDDDDNDEGDDDADGDDSFCNRLTSNGLEIAIFADVDVDACG